MCACSVTNTDPSAEWKDIRSAMRAKTRGLGCSTNLAIINASCTGGVGPDKQSNPMLAAAEQIKLELEAEEGSRRASLQSYSSNRRPSRRASRRASRRRSSRRWSDTSSGASLRSNLNDSATSRGSITTMGEDSVNIMDFGVSPRLEVLDESLKDCVLYESRRSCAALDELERLKEEIELDKSGEEELERGLNGSVVSEGDLDDYVDSYGFMNWPASTPVGKDGGEKDAGAGTGGFILDNPSVEAERRGSSQESSINSNIRRTSRRSGRRLSRRRSSRKGSFRRRSTSSLASSLSFNDSIISESGFMAWPSASQDEERADKVKREEWRIEDYEHTIDDSDRNDLRCSEGSSGPSVFAKTFQLFGRVPGRRASNASCDSSKDGPTDLAKVKQTLLTTKNKQLGVDEVEEDTGEEKRVGSVSLVSMLHQSMVGEIGPIPQALASMHDGSSGGGDTRLRCREQAIWMRQESNVDEEPDVYKKLYAFRLE